MKDLRCMLGLHSWRNVKCMSCNGGWRRCRRCGDFSGNISETNYDKHVTLCGTDEQ